MPTTPAPLTIHHLAAKFQDIVHYFGTVAEACGHATHRGEYAFQDWRSNHLVTKLAHYETALRYWRMAASDAYEAGLIPESYFYEDPFTVDHNDILNEGELGTEALKGLNAVTALATSLGINAYRGILLTEDKD